MPDFQVKKHEDGRFSVSLPHQCDRWAIVGDPDFYGAELATAVDELQKFLDEGSLALAHLKHGNEFGRG